MTDLGQPPLFMIRAGDETLDEALEERGYAIKDPVLQFVASVRPLSQIAPPPIATFTIWPPLAIMTDLWAEGGIGPGRIAVMDQVSDAKIGILARQAGRAAGCGFVALDGRVAMVHALEVAANLRRKGAAANMMRAAARWAAENGAEHLAVVVTAQNEAAVALYSGMGMTQMGRYHYRIRIEE